MKIKIDKNTEVTDMDKINELNLCRQNKKLKKYW